VSETKCQKNRRLLVIDDNRAIQDDFRKVLGASDVSDTALRNAEDSIFGCVLSAVRECLDRK